MGLPSFLGTLRGSGLELGDAQQRRFHHPSVRPPMDCGRCVWEMCRLTRTCLT